MGLISKLPDGHLGRSSEREPDVVVELTDESLGSLEEVLLEHVSSSGGHTDVNRVVKAILELHLMYHPIDNGTTSQTALFGTDDKEVIKSATERWLSTGGKPATPSKPAGGGKCALMHLLAHQPTSTSEPPGPPCCGAGGVASEGRASLGSTGLLQPLKRWALMHAGTAMFDVKVTV